VGLVYGIHVDHESSIKLRNIMHCDTASIYTSTRTSALHHGQWSMVDHCSLVSVRVNHRYLLGTLSEWDSLSSGLMTAQS
jgi:hypothetical protein